MTEQHNWLLVHDQAWAQYQTLPAVKREEGGRSEMEEREKHRNKSDKERLVFKWCKCKHICMYALVINNNCLHVHWFLFLYPLCWWSDGSAASLDILLYPILQSNGEIHVKHITWQSCDRKNIFSLWKLSFLCLINANFVLLCMYMFSISITHYVAYMYMC